jgi:hypothetical protein
MRQQPLSLVGGSTVTIRIAGNSPRSGEHSFTEGVTLGQVFDDLGGSPREGFRPSRVLVVRRWFEVNPHSIAFDMIGAQSWRKFPLVDKDCVIYQYDLDPCESGMTNG